MAERYANCTVHHSMHSDRRFDLLAQLAGWSRPEACWRMVELWARCTALKTDRPPAEEIRIHLGLRGEQLLVDAVLGERTQDGSVRVLGGGLTGGDTDRFGWYEPIEARNSAGGRARADQVRREGRGAGGKFAAAGASVHQQPTSNPTSVTSDPPATTSNQPASGFRIPEEDQKLSPACDPAVLTTPPPAAATPPVTPPGESAWHRRLRWWTAMLEADARIRAAGIEPSAPSLPKAPAGANEVNMNRCEQNLLAEGRQSDEVDAKMRHIVLVAEAEAMRDRHRRWFKPALIWDPVRAARAVDTSLKEAGSQLPQRARPRPGDPAPPAPPSPPSPKRVEKVIPADERAEVAAMAAELRDRLAGKARAPPASAGPSDESNQQPQPKAAT